jgi:hypothetical protein
LTVCIFVKIGENEALVVIFGVQVLVVFDDLENFLRIFGGDIWRKKPRDFSPGAVITRHLAKKRFIFFWKIDEFIASRQNSDEMFEILFFGFVAVELKSFTGILFEESEKRVYLRNREKSEENWPENNFKKKRGALVFPENEVLFVLIFRGEFQEVRVFFFPPNIILEGP